MGEQHDLPGADAAADETFKEARRPAPAIDQKIQDAIGRTLKAHYDDLVNAPVPDRFLALLAALQAKEEERDS